MLVSRLGARGFRSLADLDLDLETGITAVVGPNGAGKTNLLESLAFGLTGRSFRTNDRRELIAFGGPLARVEVLTATAAEVAHAFVASVSRAEGRRHLLDGAPLDPSRPPAARPHLAIFSPDRLSLVKGPPGERRAELDRLVAALWPGRADLRRRYGQALAQRNALLGRVAGGVAPATELDAWDGALAAAAAPLIAAREEAASRLAPAFAVAGDELGLGDQASLRYAPRAEGDAEAIREELGDRREADLRLARCSWGPHLDELQIASNGRSLRRYGSQGQQRAGLLALLFAEREALLESGAPAPLMLLDDVMSELDGERRRLLTERLSLAGQALLTATDATELPAAAASRQLRLRDGALVGLAEAA